MVRREEHNKEPIGMIEKCVSQEAKNAYMDLTD
jgi:hypothetical protein